MTELIWWTFALVHGCAAIVSGAVGRAFYQLGQGQRLARLLSLVMASSCIYNFIIGILFGAVASGYTSQGLVLVWAYLATSSVNIVPVAVLLMYLVGAIGELNEKPRGPD